MVKKIIKGPYSLFETDCAKCGCRFEYDLDVVNVIDGKCFVGCPKCTFNTEHYGSMEGKNRKEVEPDELPSIRSGYCHICGQFVEDLLPFEREKCLICKTCKMELMDILLQS